MGHALHVAEKSPSQSPSRTVSHAPLVMRQAALTSQDILQPKADRCACGGSCPRCRDRLPIQEKLAISWAELPIREKLVINEPGDQYEQDADRIAEQVMRTPAPEVQRQAVPIIPLVQRKTGSDGAGKIVPPIVNDVLSSPGQPLDRTTRTFFEPRFGQDFSRMRIHADAHAAESARAVEARAYTVGQHVVFGSGEYAPATAAGRRLLAHELTHVAQQDREYADDLGVMQRSPLECSQRFRQTERVYYGGTEEFARQKLLLTGKVDPTILSKFRTFGLRAFPDLMKLLKDNNLDFDTNQPLAAVDCSPGPGFRYPYPHGNALGLEAVELCQEGDYVKFNFICVEAVLPAEGPITSVPVAGAATETAEEFGTALGKSLAGNITGKMLAAVERVTARKLSQADAVKALDAAVRAMGLRTGPPTALPDGSIVVTSVQLGPRQPVLVVRVDGSAYRASSDLAIDGLEMVVTNVTPF